MSVAVKTQPTFSAALPQLLLEKAFSDYDIAADGRIVIVEAPDASAALGQLNVILNWFDDVKQRTGSH